MLIHVVIFRNTKYFQIIVAGFITTILFSYFFIKADAQNQS